MFGNSYRNDSKRWGKIKKFTSVKQTITFAKAATYARKPAKEQGLALVGGVHKKGLVFGLNVELAARAAEFSQAAYIAKKSYGDTKKSENEKKEAIVDFLNQLYERVMPYTTLGKKALTLSQRSDILKSKLGSFWGASGRQRNRKSENFGFVARDRLSNGQDIIFISWRGTDSIADYETDMNTQAQANLEKLSRQAYVRGPSTSWKCAKGFLDTYKSARSEVIQLLDEAMKQRSQGSAPVICITGHSLGAALATICAADLEMQGYSPVLYNYASPRTFDIPFSTWFSEKVAHEFDPRVHSFRSWRINQQGDPVPHLPKKSGKHYRHVHNLWQLERGPAVKNKLGHSMAHYVELVYKHGFGYEVDDMGWSLLGSGNRQIGDPLFTKAADVQGKDVSNLFLRDVTNYFMKVGIDHKGDLQSYQYSKGRSVAGTLKIDAVALAAACAGAPVPELPVFAEVGGKISVQKTKNTLVAVYVPQRIAKTTSRTLITSKKGLIMFLGMSGYKWQSGIEVSAEVGVKTPDIPGLPSTGSGDSVKSGAYGELVALELGAKASVAAKAGITGERLYLSDTCPSYISRDAGSPTTEIQEMLTKVLRDGNKKSVIKHDIKTFLTFHGKRQKRNIFSQYLTGGNVSTNKLIKALKSLEPDANPNLKQQIAHYIKSLEDFRVANQLGSYNFVSLWGMKPEASAGMSAQASAKVQVGAKVGIGTKKGIGIGGAGAEAEVVVTGPSLSVALKATHYRSQFAALAAKSSDRTSKKNSLSQYIISTQDTKITYGQLDMTAIGISGNLAVNANHKLLPVNPTLKEGETEGTHHSKAGTSTGQGSYKVGLTGVEGEVEGSHTGRVGEASGKVRGKLSLSGVDGSVEGSARLRKALNYMYYESAVAAWMPPVEPGTKKKKKRSVQLATGSGFCFGQSVDIVSFAKHLRSSRGGKKCGYIKRLAGSIGVSETQLREFIAIIDKEEDDSLVSDLARAARTNNKEYATHVPVPTAFLIEASFVPKTLPKIEAHWKNGRWMLGPGGRGKTLRGALISKKRSNRRLQAIRLRYRMADEINNESGKFSLGFKFVVKIGIETKAVEQAGSEGIVTLNTTWFNDFNKYNSVLSQTEACEKCVPQVSLFHQ